MSLFGGQKVQMYVVTKSLYEQQRDANALYHLKQRLSPTGETNLYVAFKNPEPFLTETEMSKKDRDNAVKLAKSLVIPVEQAEELILAKKLGCPLMLSQRQIWLVAAAKKAGVATEVFK